MARVIDTGGIPTILPDARPPTDYQNISAQPQSFGGLIGGAEQRAGGEIQQGSNELASAAIQQQGIFNQVAATQAYGQLQHEWNNRLFGDPTKPGDTGFLGLSGQDAMNARPQVQSDMENYVQQISKGLQNDRQRIEFADAARRLNTINFDQMGRHYEQQSKVWGISTMSGVEESTNRAIANTYNDDTAFANGLETIRGAAVKRAQLSGADPLATADEAVSKAVIARVDGAIAQNDYVTANHIFQQYNGLLDPQSRAVLQTHLKSKADDGIAADAIARATGKATPNWETQHNNLAGMRIPGVYAPPSQGGFQSFPTPEADIQAISHQLDLYAQGSPATGGQPLSTLRQIVSTWAPPSTPQNPKENDTPALIDRASRITGFAPDETLNIRDPATKEKLIGALIRGEQGGKLPVDPSIIHNVAFSGQAQPTTLGTGTPTPAPQQPPGMADLAAAQAELAQTHAATVSHLLDDPVLAANPEAKDKALQQEDLQFRAKDMALTAQRQAMVEQHAAAADGYVQRMMTGTIDPNIITDIARDPKLDVTTRENLGRIYQEYANGKLGGDLATYGPKFYDYFQRIHASPDDPNKIIDPTQIYQLAVPKPDGTRDLTIQGADKLVSELKANNHPETVAESEVRKGVLAYARQQITGVGDPDADEAAKLAGIYSPKAINLFNMSFIPAFYKYWDAGIAAGKTPQELADHKAIDDLVKPIRDQIHPADTLKQATQPTGAAKVDLNSRDGIVSAYQNGQISRDDAAKRLINGGWAVAPQVPPAQPEAPLETR